MRSPRGRIASAAVAAVFVVLSLSLPAGAQQSAQTAKELDEAKKKLAQLEKEVAAAVAERQAVQRQADYIAGQVHEAQDAIEATSHAITQTEKGIAKKEQRIADLEERLGLRARSAYIEGPGGIFEVIFGATSFSDLSRRLELYDAVQQSDADLATQIETEKVKLQDRKKELGDLKAQQIVQKSELEARLAEMTAKLARMQEITKTLSTKQAEADELVETLTVKLKKEKAAEEAARRAAELARQLSGGGGGGSAPPPNIGGDGPFYTCPVAEPNSFSNDFGAPRSGGRTHQGNDIFAPYGTPIRAPFNGTASSGWNSLGGLSVYVYGGGGFVYNAHLSSVGNLGSVSTGTVIGYVGNSGNARYTPPHDHFEWHPGGGSAVNPYYYLLEVCR